MRVRVEEADKTTSYDEDNYSIPKGLYVDDDGDFVVINHANKVATVLLRGGDGGLYFASDLTSVAWPITPAPSGTKLVIEA